MTLVVLSMLQHTHFLFHNMFDKFCVTNLLLDHHQPPPLCVQWSVQSAPISTSQECHNVKCVTLHLLLLLHQRLLRRHHLQAPLQHQQ